MSLTRTGGLKLSPALSLTAAYTFVPAGSDAVQTVTTHDPDAATAGVLFAAPGIRSVCANAATGASFVCDADERPHAVAPIATAASTASA
jgi:hypothetical protein